jgi:hypothetical protein
MGSLAMLVEHESKDGLSTNLTIGLKCSVSLMASSPATAGQTSHSAGMVELLATQMLVTVIADNGGPESNIDNNLDMPTVCPIPMFSEPWPLEIVKDNQKLCWPPALLTFVLSGNGEG